MANELLLALARHVESFYASRIDQRVGIERRPLVTKRLVVITQ